MERYTVVVKTPKGTFDVEVPTYQGPEAAARRAKWSLIHMRYGDVDEVHILSTTLIEEEL